MLYDGVGDPETSSHLHEQRYVYSACQTTAFAWGLGIVFCYRVHSYFLKIYAPVSQFIYIFVHASVPYLH